MANRPMPKILRVLAHLARGRRLHRFEAERVVHDHSLPSTIAEIQKRYGIRIDRQIVEVPGYAGAPARVAEYWIADLIERVRAQQIVRDRGKGKPAVAAAGSVDSNRRRAGHVQKQV